jgi:hypothetical protein
MKSIPLPETRGLYLAAPVLIDENQRHVFRDPENLILPAISMHRNDDHGNERVAKT